MSYIGAYGHIYDDDGRLLSDNDPDTGEPIMLPKYDPSLGYEYDFDLGDSLYLEPTLMCPRCGSYRNHHVDHLPYRYACKDCGKIFEYGYPHANDAKLGSYRYNIVDKATGKVLASDLTVEEASDWVYGYNSSPEGKRETKRIARKFSDDFYWDDSEPNMEFREWIEEEIAGGEAQFINHNQAMPLMEVGESISYPERKWKLVRSKAKKSKLKRG